MATIRFGIVGTGNIAHRFAEAIRNTKGAVLTAVASRTAAGAEAFGNEFDIPHRFAGYEAMAASDVIDAALTSLERPMNSRPLRLTPMSRPPAL